MVEDSFFCLLSGADYFVDDVSVVAYAEGGSGKRKGGKNASKNKSGPVSVDHNYLASNYYGTIVAGLSLIRDLPQALG